MNEKKIILGLQRKSEKVFDYVYHKYHRLVYYFSLRIVKSTSNANEIANNTFIKMYEEISKDEIKPTFTVWLLNLAESLSLHYDKCGNDDEYLKSSISEVLTEEEFDILNYRAVFNLPFTDIAFMFNYSKELISSIYDKAIKKLKGEM